MRKSVILVIIAAVIMLAASAAMAKTNVWDLIFDDNTQSDQKTGESSYSVEIRLTNGERFSIETKDADYSDVEFNGVLKLDQPDGTYYVNSSQVEYIKVKK